jgi:hypothetical protein
VLGPVLGHDAKSGTLIADSTRGLRALWVAGGRLRQLRDARVERSNPSSSTATVPKYFIGHLASGLFGSARGGNHRRWRGPHVSYLFNPHIIRLNSNDASDPHIAEIVEDLSFGF